jgi:hypothetical protein
LKWAISIFYSCNCLSIYLLASSPAVPLALAQLLAQWWEMLVVVVLNRVVVVVVVCNHKERI